MHKRQSLAPEVNGGTRVLVFGTMPGVRSLRLQEYYAHPQNFFWRLVQELVGVSIAAPYRERVDRLLSAGIGLWDTLESCDRQGGLDSNIRNATPNDVNGRLANHPEVTVLALNGRKAGDVVRRRILPTIAHNSRLTVLELPSASPANARGGLQALLKKWQVLDLPPFGGGSYSYRVMNMFELQGFAYPVLLLNTDTVEGRGLMLLTFTPDGNVSTYRTYEYAVRC